MAVGSGGGCRAEQTACWCPSMITVSRNLWPNSHCLLLGRPRGARKSAMMSLPRAADLQSKQYSIRWRHRSGFGRCCGSFLNAVGSRCAALAPPHSKAQPRCAANASGILEGIYCSHRQLRGPSFLCPRAWLLRLEALDFGSGSQGDQEEHQVDRRCESEKKAANAGYFVLKEESSLPVSCATVPPVLCDPTANQRSTSQTQV